MWCVGVKGFKGLGFRGLGLFLVLRVSLFHCCCLSYIELDVSD